MRTQVLVAALLLTEGLLLQQSQANYQASQPSQRIPDTNSMTWTVPTNSIVTVPFTTSAEATPASGTDSMGTNGPAMCSMAGTQTITVTDASGNQVAYLDLKNGGGTTTGTGTGIPSTGPVGVSASYLGLSTAFNGSFNNSGLRGTFSYSGSGNSSGTQNVSGSGTATQGSTSGTEVAGGIQSVSYSGTFSFYAPAGTYTIASNGGTTITPGVTVEGEGSQSDVGSVISAGVSFDLVAQTPTNAAISPLPTGKLAVQNNNGAGGVTLQWSITPSN